MPTRSDESRWPSTTRDERGSCCICSAISIQTRLVLVVDSRRVEREEDRPARRDRLRLHDHRRRNDRHTSPSSYHPDTADRNESCVVPTLTDTVTVPADIPVVSSVTSAPVVDESVPPVVDQVKLAPSAPVAVALNVTRSPDSTDEAEALMSQVTVGHGGSVTSKLAVQVVWPVVTQSLGQSTAGHGCGHGGRYRVPATSKRSGRYINRSSGSADRNRPALRIAHLPTVLVGDLAGLISRSGRRCCQRQAARPC